MTHRVVNGMMTALDEMNPIELEAGATHGVITSESIDMPLSEWFCGVTEVETGVSAG